METLLHSRTSAVLTELLRRAPWMDEADRQADGFTLLDHAILGTGARSIRLLVVAPDTDLQARWFVPVVDGVPTLEATRTGLFDELVVGALREGLRLPTAGGNLIEFRGTPPPYGRPLPFDPGWSSNALSLIELDGVAHAHKTYRRMSESVREPDLLRLMAEGGRTQRLVGEYAYLDTVTGVRQALGVLYVFADGDGLDLPLRHSVRSLWPLLRNGVDIASAVSEAQHPIAGPLADAGRFLRGFHQELAERLGPAPEFPAAEYLAETAERVAELRPLILGDERFPRAVCEAAVAALERESGRLRDAPPTGWPSGPSHGDLHLSHFLRRERADGGWDMCVIDLSTPALDPASPDFAAQSPWQDLVALYRGLECFTADEFAHQAALELDLDSEETCRTALLTTAGVAPDTPGWTAERLGRLTTLRQAAQTWADRVGRLLLSGYAGDGPSPDRHPAWRLFHLRRLIHELAYAYAHDRPYHAAINLRHAVAAGSLSTGPTKD